MELFEFTKILKELNDYYEHREVKQGSAEIWFQRVRNIPSEPIRWMLQKIEGEGDAYPRNIPGALWGAFREWQQAHPERIAQQTFKDCPDCEEGLIYARNKTHGNNYQYVFRCGRCKQSTLQGYPMATRLELSGDYEVNPKYSHGMKSKFPRVQLRMDELVRRMAKEYYEPLMRAGKVILLDVEV